MPRVDSRAEKGFELRHRIVGALVLLACAVVILPLILRGPDTGRDTSGSGQAPSPAVPIPEGFVSKVMPVPNSSPDSMPAPDNIDLIVKASPETPERKSSEPAPAVPEPVDTTTKMTKSDPVKKVEKDEEKAKVIPSAPPAQPPSTTVARGWVVQVGTYGKPENVERMVEQLKGKGFTARTTSITTDSGKLTRVWVGPYEQRVQAGRAQSEIKSALGAKGLIVAYP